ncbi:MAG TPA: cupin domain-containing protein [Chthoniobacterales bacterium]
MKVASVQNARECFEVLQTGEKSQIAVMTLRPGGASGSSASTHEKSEQVLLVLKGEVEGEIGSEKRLLHEGDAVLIPAGVKHRFVNRGDPPAVIFNVYSPGILSVG